MKVRMLRNLVGPQVRRFRCLRNWSQEELASKLQLMGWNVCRGRVARIEAGEAWVSDIEHFLLTKVFNVKMEDLLPKMDGAQPIYFVLWELTGGQLKMLMPPENVLADKNTKHLNGNNHSILSRIQDKSPAQKQ
jgi:transcriptional regulator with XRE-family HTH domain